MKNICEQAALYFYDELEPAQRAAFQTHLKECNACQKELAFMQQVQAALVPPAAPQAVVEQVLRKPQRVSFWRAWCKPAFIAVLLMGLAVGGYFGRGMLQNTSQDTQEWLAYVSDDIDEEYYNFVSEFEAFENEF